MQFPSTLAAYLRLPDGRPIPEIDADIVDELNFHIEMRTEDSLRAGMTPQAARDDALARFGDFGRTYRRCRRILLGDRIMLQRLQTVLTVILLGAVVYLALSFYVWQQKQAAVTAQILDSLAPAVVQTTPRNGQSDVDPALAEIRVTYSKPMMDKSWSWCHDPEQLATAGEPHYEADGKTCVLPVKLQPGKTYVIWLNSEDYHNFKDSAGRSAAPYKLSFSTRP
jgi:hypothetical protein